MNKPIVQLKKVTKKIGHKTIVDGLTLNIGKGEVFGLLGPNGAGKTTTIRMMVGLISLTDGEILIHNKSITKDFKQAIAHVGAIVENPELYKFLTGYQNLKHFANMSPGVSVERIEEVISIVGLEKRIHDKVQTYSLGMRQRLGVAQALLHKPSVLILDEPTNGLDPAGIKELREYLRNLARSEDVSIIVSSHLLTEMELMCDRVAIIQQGKLIKEQEMDNLIEQNNKNSWFILDVDKPTQAKFEIEKYFAGTKIEQQGNFLLVVANRDIIADINAYLIGQNIKVFGIRPKSKSLEERFMEATRGGGIA